jgi:DNA-binding NarL/FixJ family response regulator
MPEPPQDRGRATVLIVEDHEMLSEALSLSLEARGFQCTIAAINSAEGVLAQAARCRPQLVLLDLDLGGMDGVDLIAGLRATGASVLVVTGQSDLPRLAETLALGAIGWVSKTEPFERLLEAAEVALHGRALLAPARQAELVDLGWASLTAERGLKKQMARLTPREAEVLAALGNGMSAEEIAGELFVSVGTVRTHIRGVLTKLGVSSQLAAVAKAHELAGHR